MADFELSRITALDYVGEREWKKGSPYVRGLSGLTAQPDGEAVVLQASAHGQEKYTVRVTVEDGEITESDCSCPVGTGSCKHVAALLARAVQTPQDFTDLPDLAEVLGVMDESELRGLVRLMLGREPSLMRLVVTRPRKSTEGRSNLRQRIEDAFSLVDYDPEEDWEGEGPDLSDFPPLLEEAGDLLAQAEALDDQGRIDLLDAYLAVLSGCGELNDDGYDLGLDDLTGQARTGVLRLMQFPLDEHARENALDGLQESIGDLGWHEREFRPPGQAELFSTLPAGERQVIVDFVRKLMNSERTDYRKRAYAGTLLMLSEGETLGFKEELQLARATGDQAEVVAVLFKNGHTEEAIQALTGGRRPLAPQEVEQHFRERDLLAQLEDYAAQHLKVFGSRAWLYGRYRETGRNAQAHALARDAVLKGTGEHEYYASHFLTRDLDWLKELRAVSPDWAADRDEYVKKLWAAPAMTNHLMRFLLGEHLLDRAEELANRESKKHVPVSPGLLTELALQLPAERAKPLLLKAVLAYVNGRGREEYRAAAETLTRASTLLGPDEVQAIARLLVRDFPTLRALKDELGKAGLL